MFPWCAHLDPKSNTSGGVPPLKRLIAWVFGLFCSVLLFSPMNDENKLPQLRSHFKTVKIRVTDWVATFQKEQKLRPHL